MAQDNGTSGMEEDLFENLFGGGARFGFDFGMGNGARRRPSKGEDSVIPYDVTLEDLYNGKIVKMMMEREVVCSVCKGLAILLGTNNLTESFVLDRVAGVMPN